MNYLNKTPIKIKRKLCCTCGSLQPIFSKNRCKSCSQKQDVKPIKKKLKPKNKELDNYFEKHIEILNKFRRSEESGDIIPYPSKLNICHILDKGRHKSVSSNMYNCIYLTWDEHAKFDQLLFQHRFDKLEEEFPNSWGIVKARLRIIIPLCNEKTEYLKALEKIVFHE